MEKSKKDDSNKDDSNKNDVLLKNNYHYNLWEIEREVQKQDINGMWKQ